MTDDDPPSLSVRRDRYHRVLTVLEANSGDPQPVIADAGGLWTTLVANGSTDHDIAQKSMRAAVDNGHAIRWTDPEDRVRYGLTTDGVREVPTLDLPVFDPCDADALRAVVETEVDREDTDTDIVAWANQHLATLTEDDE